MDNSKSAGTTDGSGTGQSSSTNQPKVHAFDKPRDNGMQSNQSATSNGPTTSSTDETNQSSTVFTETPYILPDSNQSPSSTSQNTSSSPQPPPGTTDILHSHPNDKTRTGVTRPSAPVANEPPPAYSELIEEGSTFLPTAGQYGPQQQVYTIPTTQFPPPPQYTQSECPPLWSPGAIPSLQPGPVSQPQPQPVATGTQPEIFYLRVMARALGHQQPFESLSRFRQNQIRRIVQRQRCPNCQKYSSFLLENSRSYTIMMTLMSIALVAVFVLLIAGAVFGGRVSFFICIGGRGGNCMTRHKIRRCKHCNHTSSSTMHWMLSGFFAFCIAAEIAAIVAIIVLLT